jgi:hypothetical protein
MSSRTGQCAGGIGLWARAQEVGNERYRTQLVTAGAALLGVFLTLIATDIRERNRDHANDRRLELTRVHERAKWFDSEKRVVYADLIQKVATALEKLAGAAPRDGGSWDEDRLIKNYRELRKLALEAEIVLASIEILGSENIQGPAKEVMQALAHAYSQLDVAHDFSFRDGEIYIPRGKSKDDLPDEPVSLTYQLFDVLAAKRQLFLKAARLDLAPPGL